MTAPIIVKLGGSLAGSERLRDWMAAIGSARPPVVVVAGGGPFADQVRASQRCMGFTDEAAHVMALHAMAQFGWALCGLNARFATADTPEAIDRAYRNGRIPVWNPVAMAASAPEIPQSWSVTSDSLAAWLAARLAARAVVFVKQANGLEHAWTAQALADAGVLDPMTPSFLASSAVEAWLAGPSDCAALSAALAQGEPAAWPIAA